MKSVNNLFLLLCVFFIQSGVESSNIMLFSPVTSKSETLMLYPYAEALAQKGHKVTVVCPYAMKNNSANIRHVNPPELKVLLDMIDEEGSDFLVERIARKYYDEVVQSWEMTEWCLVSFKALLLDSTEILDMIKNKEKFDLIIINGAGNVGGLVLVDIFKSPFVYLDGPGFYPFQGEPTGNHDFSAVTPTISSAFSTPMSFYERLYNTYANYKWRRDYTTAVIETEKMLRPVYEKYGMVHPLLEVERNVSLVLNYRHASLEFPRAFYPNVVRFGCVHCREPKPLPKDIKDFISLSGEHGFVVFSLGSVCKLQKNKEFFRKNFFQAFAKMPQKFLVKWDADVTNEEIGAPPNVKIMSWLPLQDLIAQPNCRAFISHSGLFSTMESVYHGVPMISIPMFYDQDYNANLVEKFGMGIKLEAGLITGSVMLETLNKIVSLPSYRQNALARSKILRDQPMAPIDSMVYWSEYVIRHKGADHLRPIDVINMPWYQLWMVDAVVLFAIGLLILFIVPLKFVKCIFCASTVTTPKQKTH